MNLSTTIKSIQDIMRKDDGVDGDAQRIGQLTWMLFLKVFDQREEEWEDERPNKKKPYVSPMPERCRWRNWAAYVKDEQGKSKPQMPGSELVDFVNNTLFPALQNLESSDDPKRNVIRQVFQDSNNYMKSGTLILEVIEKLDQAIDVHDFKTRQNLGDIYEQVLNDLRGAGNAGEFYTPRAITHFMMERVNPRLDLRETVMDPACGTGGFLTAAIEHMKGQITAKSSAEDKKAIEGLVKGIEKKQLPHLLCTTNLLLHEIDVPNQARLGNTLAQNWNEWGPHDQVTCVVTNPPFGGMEEGSVGSDYPADVRTRETADMFLTLIVRKLLKDGGRAAVVLPDGILFGDGIKGKVKEKLLEDCNLHTIIRLPNGVFAPYTSIKTNLLFFTKGKSTETIWFYEHPYPEGYKSYSKTKPVRLEEFELEKSWWGNESDGFSSRVESERAWKLDFKTLKANALAKANPLRKEAEALDNKAKANWNWIADLRENLKTEKNANKRAATELQISGLQVEAETCAQKAREAQAAADRHYWPIYNLDLKNPNGAEAETHDPDVLLAKYKALLTEIDQVQEQLRGELAAALSHHFEVGEESEP
ncbi:MAG: SAM-dependent DNA methyltransferase [Fibrobacterota bacterium]|nr:MAG: SAM-dependent DNA methyltransferase [Fibrobacterota bacterium]